MKPLLVVLSCGALIMFSLTNCSKTTDTIHDTVTIKKTDTITLHKTDTLYHGDTIRVTLTLQPGINEGQNTLVTSDLYAIYNLNANPDVYAGTWTYGAQGGGTGIGRTYLKFIGLD